MGNTLFKGLATGAWLYLSDMIFRLFVFGSAFDELIKFFLQGFSTVLFISEYDKVIGNIQDGE